MTYLKIEAKILHNMGPNDVHSIFIMATQTVKIQTAKNITAFLLFGLYCDMFFLHHLSTINAANDDMQLG